MRTSQTRLLGSAALRLVFYAHLADSFPIGFPFDFAQGFGSSGLRLTASAALRVILLR